MKSPHIHWISRDDPVDSFPDVEQAFGYPDGLLAAGGDLSLERLVYAYRHGIFPWYSDGQPILWWSPDPRCIIYPREFHVARRLRRSLAKSNFSVRFNSDFDSVVERCAAHRPGQDGTWITDDMRIAYGQLHRQGWAHSIEIVHDGALVGGLYGIAIGKAFFGESMFSKHSNASKAAMLALCVCLVERKFELLDCQVQSPHLMTLGARCIPRRQFTATLQSACQEQIQTKMPATSGVSIDHFLNSA